MNYMKLHKVILWPKQNYTAAVKETYSAIIIKKKRRKESEQLTQDRYKSAFSGWAVEESARHDNTQKTQQKPRRMRSFFV